MSHFFLEQGLVIERFGQVLEYVARTDTELYFEDPKTAQRITLTEPQFWGEFQTLRIKIVDAFSSPDKLVLPEVPESEQLESLEDLPTKDQLETMRKLDYIKYLKKAGISRGQKQLIEDEAKKIAVQLKDTHVPGVSTIQNWWKQLDKSGGDIFAVVSCHAKRKKSGRVDEESEGFLQQMIDEKYAIDTRPSKAGAYMEYETAVKTENKQRVANNLPQLQIVSARTFENRIEARPKEEIMIARLGREATRRYFKMVKGHLPSEHPLDVVEIDHTPMNLFVLDDLAYLPLGRPWMTAIKDRHTGVLLGFYICFQAAGLNSIFGALKHSLTSHHQAYQIWPEIENPWPSFGLGATYLSDRGGDFISPRYQFAIRELRAEYEYCERRTPWLKPSVERFFLTLEQTFFEAIKGRTFANLQLRGDYDPKKDAVVRFTTLIFLLHKWAADFHNIYPDKRKQVRPIDLWMDGIGVAPPPYYRSPDAMNIILGERYQGCLSHEGIRHDWMTYADDQLNDLMRDIGKGVKLDFVVTNEDLGRIHVLDPRTKTYFSVANTRPEYANGLSTYQHKYLRKEAGVRLEKATAIDTLIETRARIAEVTQEELQARQNGTKSKLARVAGHNSNAVLEGRTPSILTPFSGQQLGCEAASAEVECTPSFTNVPSYSWGL